MKFILAVLLLLGVPASTLAVTLHDDRRASSAVVPNKLKHKYGGVGIVSNREGGGCTGTALTRRAVLTAAHCVGPRRGGMRFVLPLRGNREIRRGGRAEVYPGYKMSVGSSEQKRVPDAAIIKLKRRLPKRVPTYAILDAAKPPVGHAFEFVGFGDTGDGSFGQDWFQKSGIKRFARNELERVSGRGTYIGADFDDGRHRLWGRNTFGSSGLGVLEGMIASGDSGGPAFYSQRLAARLMKQSDPSLRFGRLSDRPLIIGVASHVSEGWARRYSTYGSVGYWAWSGAFVDWLEDIAPGVKIFEDAVVCARGTGCGTRMSEARPAGTVARVTSRAVATASPVPVPLNGTIGFLAAGIATLGVTTFRRRIVQRPVVIGVAAARRRGR